MYPAVHPYFKAVGCICSLCRDGPAPLLLCLCSLLLCDGPRLDLSAAKYRVDERTGDVDPSSDPEHLPPARQGVIFSKVSCNDRSHDSRNGPECVGDSQKKSCISRSDVYLVDEDSGGAGPSDGCGEREEGDGQDVAAAGVAHSDEETSRRQRTCECEDLAHVGDAEHFLLNEAVSYDA